MRDGNFPSEVLGLNRVDHRPGEWRGAFWAVLAVVLSGLALLTHWIWSCRRGLEFTDEGLYLLASEQPWRNIHSSFFGFGLHPLYLLAGNDPGFFRILALAMVLVSGGILAWAWGSSRGGKLFRGLGAWVVAGAVISGCLLTFSDGRRTPGYDTLVFVGACLGWSGYFRLCDYRVPLRLPWILLAAGILFCALGKWAVALLLAPLWIGLLVARGQRSLRTWFCFFLVLTAGLTGLAGWIGVESLQRAWKEAGYIVQQMGTHGTKLIPYYGITLVNFAYRVLRAFVYGLPILLLLVWVRRRRPAWIEAMQRPAAVLVWLILPLGILLGLTKAGSNGFSRVGSNVTAELLWLLCAAGIFRGSAFLRGAGSWENLGIAATPFLLGVGTATALGDYVGHGAVFFQLMGLGIWSRWTSEGLNPGRAIPWIALTALLNLVRAENSLRDQFRTPELASCIVPWKRPDGNTVYLHPNQRAMLESLQKSLSQLGFQPGDPLIAVGDLPGVVYLLGGWSPGTSWYFAYQLGSSRYVEAVLASVPPEIRTRSFLLFRENSPLYSERRQAILGLLEQQESPAAEVGPLTFEEMNTRLMIWGPKKSRRPVNDRP